MNNTVNFLFQPKSDFSRPTPITHPLYPAATNGTSEAIAPSPYNDVLNQPPQMFQPTPTPPLNQTFAAPQINPSGFNQNALNPGIVAPPQQQGLPPKQNAPSAQEVTEREKAPLPDEHKILQNVFDDLRNQCSFVAGNPVSKKEVKAL